MRSRSALDSLLGESTMTGDIVPVLVGAPRLTGAMAAQKKKEEEEAEKARKALAAKPIGEADETVIPAEAKVTNGVIDVPQTPSADFIPTSVALVAPDTTPNAAVPLDPGQLPIPAQVMDVQSQEKDAMRVLLNIHQASSPQSPGPGLPGQQQMTQAEAQQKAKVLGQNLLAESMAKTKTAAIMDTNKMREHKHNPNSLSKALDVARMFS